MNIQTPEQEQEWQNNSSHWKFFNTIYYNPKDNRIFVPKKIKWMGITLNFANPKSYAALLIMMAFFGFIIFMIETKN